MLAQLEQSAALVSAADLKGAKHALVIIPKAATLDGLRGLPGVGALSATLARQKKRPADLARSPVTTNGEEGALVAWIMLDASMAVFEQQTLVRKGLQAPLAEKPEEILIAVSGPAGTRRRAAELAVYSAWANGA